jgi:protein SCO1/2
MILTPPSHPAPARAKAPPSPRRLILLALFLVGIAVTACNRKPDAPALSSNSGTNTAGKSNPVVYQVTGVLQALDLAEKRATIRHDAIPGYMAAMTMPFEVRHTNEFANLTPGDTLSFQLFVTDTEGWIEKVKKTGRATPEQIAAIPSVRPVREVEPLNVGDPLPNYRFTNELGKAVELHQFKGQALAITFVFTRCPFPDFCPRMSNNFSDAYKLLKAKADAPTNWHFFTISFDPAFDTPQTLRNYAARYKYDPERWSFLTGEIIEIDAITEQFGLWFSRTETINWDHNLRTVVIDKEGRVQQIISGNTWKPETLVEEIIKHAQ